MKNNQLTYCLLIIALLFSFGKPNLQTTTSESITENNLIQTYYAGEQVSLSFGSSEKNNLILFVSNNYGSSLLSPKYKNDNVEFVFPSFLSNKTGVIGWKLISNNKTIKEGLIKIKPTKQVVEIETYLGPIFIKAGESEFAHLVSIPVDSLDNPIEKHTEVRVNQQFYNSKTTSTVLTSNLIAFEEIGTRTKSGRISINSICENISSKELSTEINAANPINYQITAQTNHPYADGNQLATMSTSVITDKYGNVVVDGTLVKFFIKNNQNTLLQASGTTINGVATAKINHPNRANKWVITSTVPGMASSQSIQVDFFTAIKDFDVIFSDSNRNIEIGPIKSYMDQLIPDGLEVQLRVFIGDELVFKNNSQSQDGLGIFMLENSILKEGRYNIEIELGGITKYFKNIQL